MDHTGPARDFGVEVGQGVHGRLVEVGVEAQQRQLLDGSLRQRVLEPALEGLDLLVEQSVAAEVVLDLLEGDGELVVG